MSNREIERKAPLSKEEYHRLRSVFGDATREYVQVNYYYDDEEESLHRAGVTVRARRLADSLTLETKTHRRFANDARVCDEESETIDALPCEVERTVGGKTVRAHLVGELVTHRTDYVIGDCLLSLDENFYLGVVDYELELETPKEDGIPPLVAAANVTFVARAPGKVTRFFEERKRMGRVKQ